MADVITLDTSRSPSTFTTTKAFRAGYANGRDNVDEMSRGAAYEQGVEDGRTGKPSRREPEVHDVSSVAVTFYEDAAYFFGWDVGWHDEVHDQYRRGHADGRLHRLLAPVADATKGRRN